MVRRVPERERDPERERERERERELCRQMTGCKSLEAVVHILRFVQVRSLFDHCFDHCFDRCLTTVFDHDSTRPFLGDRFDNLSGPDLTTL